jgi:threonine dehydrogenase-like Zn-dependent dehydrogenase
LSDNEKDPRPTIVKGRIEVENILNKKTAVVYGAGSIGGAVASNPSSNRKECGAK